MAARQQSEGAVTQETQARAVEIERLLSERVQLAEQMATLKADLAVRNQEAEQLRAQTTKHDETLTRMADEFRVREQHLLSRAEKLKETAAQFRATFDQQQAAIGERDKAVAG